MQRALRERIRDIAETQVRYGCRQIHVLLRREGWRVNRQRVYRLVREEGLQLRSKTPKRKVSAKLRDDRSPASAPNEVWAMDFISDQLFNGRRIRILTMVDAFTRISPAIDVRYRYRGSDVVDTLERVTDELGTPKTIRVDPGLEFVSKALDLWAWLNGVTLDFSRPGKPTDNAFIESFTGLGRLSSGRVRLFALSGQPRTFTVKSSELLQSTGRVPVRTLHAVLDANKKRRACALLFPHDVEVAAKRGQLRSFINGVYDRIGATVFQIDLSGGNRKCTRCASKGNRCCSASRPTRDVQ